jgi:hypothetical protein
MPRSKPSLRRCHLLRRLFPALLVGILGVHPDVAHDTLGVCEPGIISDLQIGSDKNTLSWSAQAGVTSYDIAFMRFSGTHFDGDFTTFAEPGACGANASGCGQADTSYDMSCKGTPSIGQVDMWVVRGHCGTCSTWNEGGNQIGSRDPGGATPIPSTICPSCAAVGKTTGGGEIKVPDGTANFGFVARREVIGGQPMGQLEYYNHARSLNVHSVSILTLSVSGNTATFTGECTKNGSPPCSFTVTVEDNGEPGADVDVFTIAVSDEPVEGASAPIRSGNIQIHNSSSLSSRPEQTQNATAVAGAGSGVFPSGTSFIGVPVSGLHIGEGVDLSGNGPAVGDLEFTLLGTSVLGQPQLITVEATAAEGFIPACGVAEVSGVCSVNLGDGTPRITGVPFTMMVNADPAGQGSLTLVIGTTSLLPATIDHGRISLPECTPSPQVGVDNQRLSYGEALGVRPSGLP